MNLEFDCQFKFPDGFQLDVQFETNEACTAVFGPSGSGKTTILSLIAGTLRPDEGRVEIGGTVVTDTVPDIHIKPEHRKVGFVFQQPRLFPHKTVMENLVFGQRWRKGKKRLIDVERVAQVLEIDELVGRLPETLSGGQQQRVAVGRALVSGPDLLLMDEPLSSLDDVLKMKVLVYLERIIEEWQIPTIYVTHSHAEARRVASRIVLVNSGRLVAEGKPDDVFAQAETLKYSETGPSLNLVRVDRIDTDESSIFAWIGDRKLTLSPQSKPSLPGEHTDCFIQFSPGDVILSRSVVQGTSARNQLTGKVRQVISSGGSLFVAVDVGQILWAVLTKSAVAELDLEIGSEVACLIKAHNLRLVS